MPDEGYTIRQAFKPALGRAGLREFRFHDLRHTHATSLPRNGKSIEAVSQRLGHSAVDVTLRACSHVLPTDDADLADALDRVYGRDGGTAGPEGARPADAVNGHN